ncbi:Nudix domain-containing protein [Lasiodiplodia theobromae]|uniref:Nudix domain-containing protein n=1 Tax=Lasiodiplodia theobromae TaxID=45133 RepID=UPI0015C3B16A|nr:Nudix domain-containing protein [Lasiodiplodia theobromae]KAF4539775.1 Nudix domain-containing protein [Lasiodiplodia theobromae]
MPDIIDELSAVRIPAATRQPVRCPPVVANFPSEHLVIGCGVAIFHVASARVVLCRHTRDRYWFLPKGRRDAGEETNRAAEREGFEESGYRNRLLPLPVHHRQPQNNAATTSPETTQPPPSLSSLFVTEPLYTQLVPVSPRTQYLLFWYAAETLPPAVEAAMPPPGPGVPYVAAPPAPAAPSPLHPDAAAPGEEPTSLLARVRAEPPDYQPRRWEGTGVDEEELLYESFLVPVQEAGRKLGGGVMAEVVRRGWEGVVERMALERAVEEQRQQRQVQGGGKEEGESGELHG